MFERYTETARRVIHWSRYIAGLLGRPEIETEHLLLALLTTDKGLAKRFLGSPWAAEQIWKQIKIKRRVSIRTPKPGDLPLAGESKSALAFALEEADKVSSRQINTAHLFLGLLRHDKCFAAEILRHCGLSLEPVRKDLKQTPHQESKSEMFVRDRGARPSDIAELQTQLQSVKKCINEAIARHDFAAARTHSDEERNIREQLWPLYERYNLSDWLFE
jgi:ATP-dependent Clp protease ATP-binding subunit ClpC